MRDMIDVTSPLLISYWLPFVEQLVVLLKKFVVVFTIPLLQDNLSGPSQWEQWSAKSSLLD